MRLERHLHYLLAPDFALGEKEQPGTSKSKENERYPIACRLLLPLMELEELILERT